MHREGEKNIIEIEERAEIASEEFETTKEQLFSCFGEPDLVHMITILYPKKLNPDKPRVRIEIRNGDTMDIEATTKEKLGETDEIRIEKNTAVNPSALNETINQWEGGKVLYSVRYEYVVDGLKYILSKHADFGNTLETEIELIETASEYEKSTAHESVKTALTKLGFSILSGHKYGSMWDTFRSQGEDLKDDFVSQIENLSIQELVVLIENKQS